MQAEINADGYNYMKMKFPVENGVEMSVVRVEIRRPDYKLHVSLPLQSPDCRIDL